MMDKNNKQKSRDKPPHVLISGNSVIAPNEKVMFSDGIRTVELCSSQNNLDLLVETALTILKHDLKPSSNLRKRASYAG